LDVRDAAHLAALWRETVSIAIVLRCARCPALSFRAVEVERWMLRVLPSHGGGKAREVVGVSAPPAGPG
jgi:hypothetical protein